MTNQYFSIFDMAICAIPAFGIGLWQLRTAPNLKWVWRLSRASDHRALPDRHRQCGNGCRGVQLTCQEG